MLKSFYFVNCLEVLTGRVDNTKTLYSNLYVNISGEVLIHAFYIHTLYIYFRCCLGLHALIDTQITLWI